MAYAYCKKCQHERHWKAGKGSKISEATCNVCGGNLEAGKLLPCANPACAETRFESYKSWCKEKGMDVPTEMTEYDKRVIKVKVYPGEKPLCLDCRIKLLTINSK